MAKLRKPVALKPQSQEPSHDEAQRAIATQTEKFLKGGGVIQRIPNGVSGQTWQPSKQIKLSKRPT